MQIMNPSWESRFNDGVLPLAHENLGVASPIVANLFKFILFTSPDSIAKSSKKAKLETNWWGVIKDSLVSNDERNLLGFLILQLPSAYGGGQLKIRDKRDEKKVTEMGSQEFEYFYLTFYSDCELESLPIENGVRSLLSHPCRFQYLK